MVFGYVYETGMRKSNQDALLFRSTLLSEGELSMAVVCDGMGGEEKGEKASYECIRAFDCWYDRELLPVFIRGKQNSIKRMKQIKAKGMKIFHDINNSLFDDMRRHRERMGTTASVLIIYHKDYYLFHVGDSRIYFVQRFFQKTKFICKTKDHAKEHQLTRCLGLNKDYQPDFLWGKTFCKEFLLCTDGFWGNYHEKIWEECLDVAYMVREDKICRRLNELAKDNLRNGIRDNISALWITGKIQ